MKIIEFYNENQKSAWNAFIKNNKGSFLQSWEWGEVLRADGKKIWRIAIQEDNEKILAAAMLMERNLPFKKNYLYIPHGPIFLSSLVNISLWQQLLYKIKEIASQEQSVFLKIDPLLTNDNQDFLKIIEQFGFKKYSDSIQPRKTLILDLSKSHDNLLEEMHPKTRYNIRLARKKGILVRGWPGLSSCDYFDIFWRLMLQTVSREKIRFFPKSHYFNVFKIFGAGISSTSESSNGECELYTAEYVTPERVNSAIAPHSNGVNEVLASIFVIRWGETAIYLYGASSNKFRNLMATYLIQWEAILDAKIKGCKYYDFWGIDEKKWPGVTRFKKGFGGKEVEYIGSCDYVFKPGWYWIYKIAKKIAKKIRI